jgi:hypothetical protein
MQAWANKITGANAGGPHLFRIRTRRVARIAQFWRWPKLHARLGVKNHTMNQFIVLMVMLSTLFETGCNKSSAPTKVTEWGVVELSSDVPKHLSLGDGNDCTLSATLLPDGNLQIVIKTKEKLARGETPAGFPAGMPVDETKTITVPSGEAITSYVGHKLVRFTPQLKTL